VYYTTGDNIQASVVDWLGALDLAGATTASILGRRLASLSNEASVYYVRWNVVGVARSSYVLQGNRKGFRGDANYGGDAVYFRVNSVSGVVHREMRLGGLPDNVVEDNAISPAFVSSYIYKPGTTDRFFQALQLKGGGIRNRTTTIGGGSSYKITGISKVLQYGLITVTTNRSTVYDTAIPVVISCRGQPQFRGNWKIADSPTAGVIVLAGSERVSAPATLQGFVTLGVFDITDMTTATNFYVGAHKLGKKKYQRRGRQSPKLLRH